MEDTSKRYGKYNDDGSVTEPEVSIMTGRPICKGGSVRERITGTPFFYRFEGAFEHLVTDEQRQQWRDGAPSENKRAAPVMSRKPEPSEE